jgi:Family of unknown function (DUF6152)
MKIILAAVLLALPVVDLAWGHHSFAMFDAAHEKTLSGTIKEFQWTNPHTWVWLDVASTNGAATEEWGIEGMSPNFLGRRGWSKTTLRPGDKVTIVIHPLKDGSKGGTFMSVTLADGSVRDMMGDGASAKAPDAGPSVPRKAD